MKRTTSMYLSTTGQRSTCESGYVSKNNSQNNSNIADKMNMIYIPRERNQARKIHRCEAPAGLEELGKPEVRIRWARQRALLDRIGQRHPAALKNVKAIPRFARSYDFQTRLARSILVGTLLKVTLFSIKERARSLLASLLSPLREHNPAAR